MNKHISTLLVFCGTYLFAALFFAIATSALQTFFGQGIAGSGLIAAAIAAGTAGRTYVTRGGVAAGAIVSTVYALLMGVFIIGVTLVQYRVINSVGEPMQLSALTTDLVLPIMLILHFMILRVSFLFGSKSAAKGPETVK